MRRSTIVGVVLMGCAEQAPDEARVDAAVRDAAAPSFDASAPSLDASAPVPIDASCGAQAVSAHACLHGRDGPFRVVEQDLADVSRAHTLFTVRSSRVTFQPSEAGAYALFLRGTLESARQAGQSLGFTREPSGCDVLPSLFVLNLDQTPLELTLSGDSVALVIESLAPWACSAPTVDAGSCRRSGPCSSDDECCSYCHDYDHCH